MLRSGERQVAPTIEKIRADHRHRYEWAAKRLPAGSLVLDYGCGIGYGARILAEAGHRVVAVDVDQETLDYARKHYAHPLIEHRLLVPGESWLHETERFDVVVMFEVVEHIAEPGIALAGARAHADALFASVPNEAVFPYRCEANDFKGWAFHHRHYTAEEFEELLGRTGWEVAGWWGQAGPQARVEPALHDGRTLIASCRAAEANIGREAAAYTVSPPLSSTVVSPEDIPADASPGHVVILGLGPSLEQYLDLTKRLGGRKAFADEVWAINALGDLVQCDLVFHMDDVRVQELRAAAAPNSNIARMLDWLKTHPGPVMTSRAHPDYPGLVEFPLEDVINALGYCYFNGTAAYAAAYAIYCGARKISLFGCDYTMPNSHHAEKGRACLEFWLGVAAARGIELGFADRTTLMDTREDPADPGEVRPYGYDFDRVLIEVEDGEAKVSFRPRETPPTAAEIEARYDHSRPTVSPELLARS